MFPDLASVFGCLDPPSIGQAIQYKLAPWTVVTEQSAVAQRLRHGGKDPGLAFDAVGTMAQGVGP
jgi:hypothetical protein